MRPSPADLTLRLARWSLYCVVAVVLMFGATVAYAQLVLEPIEQRTDALTDNALPSIMHLSLARDALARMGRTLYAYTPSKAPDIESERHDLDAALAAYQSLPQFPGERPLSIKADEAVALLEEHLDEALATRNVDIDELIRLVHVADDAVYRPLALNIDHGVAEASQISSLKRRSRAVSLVLSAASLVGAIVASWLVWRSARTQSQLLTEHEALLASRATELETFAGRIAHDLKDPLGTLALRLALMKQRDEAAPERQQEHVDRAVRQVERIDHLIEGLLVYARAGENPPPGARARLRDVVDEAVEQVRPRAQALDAELRVDPIPAREVACAPGALLSVLSNLLSNAIKYVAEARKPVRQVVVHVDEGEESVHVEVADTGPGMSAHAARRAFQLVDLATVKRIVEGYGGRVGVRSVAGEGSVFWFELPKAETTV